MRLKSKVSIRRREIGDGRPCFVIAEAGGNHNLNFDQALRLIDVAADSGADAVKFSLSRAKTQYPPNAGNADYLGVETPIYEIIKKREVPYEWIPKLVKYTNDKGLVFLCSSFDEETTDVLAENGIDAFKIASYEATHHPLLRHVARKGKPIIMSVGVTLLDEIRESLEVIFNEGNDQVVLMHCVGSYPAPVEDSNLKVIDALKNEFGCPVGISDHSRDPVIVPSCAAALGADIIEKHFTISNALPGPDHKFALEPQELKAMVAAVMLSQKAVGTGRKEIAASEIELHDFARRTVFSTVKISKGDVFTKGNTAVLRRGKHKAGLHPGDYERIMGKKANRDIPEYEAIKEGDIEK